MPPAYENIKINLVKTIANYLNAIAQSRFKRDKILACKMMFDYIISEKQYILDINILDEKFIYTVKNKLIEMHGQNISWAYNYYLIIFDEIMPVIIEDDLNQNILNENDPEIIIEDDLNQNDDVINHNIIHFNDEEEKDEEEKDEEDIFYNR